MYYNIKIKSNGSEFSLETNNKDVTQREIDIYFAVIFGASEDFKSNIRKIKAVNKNLKSINEIEKPTNCDIKSFSKVNETSQQEVKSIYEFKEATSEIEPFKTEDISPYPEKKEYKPILNIKEKSKTQENDFSTIKFQNNNPQEELIDIHKTLQAAQSSYDDILTAYKEKEAENHQEEITVFSTPKESRDQTNVAPEPVAEQIIDSSDILEEVSTSKKDLTFEEVSDALESATYEHYSEPIASTMQPIAQTIKEDYIVAQDVMIEATKAPNDEAPKEETTIATIETPKTQNEIDELINLAQKKLDMVDTNEKIESVLFPNGKPQVTVPKMTYSSHEEEKETYTTNNQAKLNDIFNLQKLEETETLQENFSTPTQPQVSLAQLEVSLAPKTEEKPMPMLDFKPFLASCNCQSLYDEFVVCAYFIKHVLKQQSFTIKFINSKLFQATGKLADMAVIDEMVLREYIRIVDVETPKTYCITAEGEIQFVSLQK